MFAQAKKDPMRAARSATHYMNENNAELSQYAVLATGANYACQQLAGNSSLATVSNGASTLLMLGAFFSNEKVQYCFSAGLNAFSKVMPESIKQRFLTTSEDNISHQEKLEEDIVDAKSHAM